MYLATNTILLCPTSTTTPSQSGTKYIILDSWQSNTSIEVSPSLPPQVINTAPVASTYAVVPQYPPPNYLILNIFTLLCCCFLFGLIGIFYSIQVLLI